MKQDKSVKELVKGPILFILGTFFGMILVMVFTDLMPAWLGFTTSIAITIACICADSD